MPVFLKKVPVEWFVIVLPFLALFAFFKVLEPIAFTRPNGAFETLVSLAFSFLGFFTITILLYILYKTVYMSYLLVKRSVLDMSISRTKGLTKWFQMSYVWSLVGVVTLFLAMFYFQGELMSMLLFSHSAQEIALFSAYFTNLDVYLLGDSGLARLVHLSSQYPMLQVVSALAYDILAFVSGAILLACFLYSIKLFRTFHITFFLLFFISIPLWYLMPAVSPSQFLLEGVVGEIAPDSSYEALSVELSSALEETGSTYTIVYGHLTGLWQGKPLVLNTAKEFAITTNPSFHVALGILCVYCAWRMSLFLGIILAVYQGFNMFATVLLLQHYVIDVPFGLMVGVLSILIARYALRYESEHMNVDEGAYFKVLAVCRRDVLQFVKLFFPSKHSSQYVTNAKDIR